MGLNLKKLTWKKVGKGVGKVLDNKIVKGAAALGLAATGVGAGPAAMILGGASAGSKLAQGKRLSTALKSGATNAAATYAGMKLLPKVTGALRGGGGSGSTISGGGEIGDEIGLEGGNIAAGNPSRFRRITDFLGGSDGFHMDDILKFGSAGADAYGAYSGAKNADRYRQIAEQEYAANAPLRNAGRNMLMNIANQPALPSTASLFVDPNVPRYRRVTVGSQL